MERRIFPRILVTIPTKLSLGNVSSKPICNATLHNLSRTGGRLSLDLPKNDLLEERLSIVFPLDKNKDFNSDAQIVWTDIRQDRIKGLGLKFDYDATNQLILDELGSFIEERLPHYLDDIQKLKPIRRPGFRLTDKEKINLDILNFLCRKSPTSKSHISQHTGLNIVTITNYLKNFIRKGLVLEKGLDISSGGRRPELLELNTDYGFIIGVQPCLTELNVVCILVNLAGKILYRNRFEYSSNAEEIADRIERFITGLAVDRSKIFAIGLSADTDLDNFGSVALHLEKRFNAPVMLENSCACSLFAEIKSNLEEKDMKSFLYFGINNSLAMVQGEDLFLSQGRIGFDDQRSSDLKAQFCWLDKDCIFKASDLHFMSSDPTKVAAILSTKIAYLVNILSPDVVILGNAIEKFSPELIKRIDHEIKRWVLPDLAKKITIVTSNIPQDSAALGVCSMIIRDFFTKA